MNQLSVSPTIVHNTRMVSIPSHTYTFQHEISYKDVLESLRCMYSSNMCHVCMSKHREEQLKGSLSLSLSLHCG